MPKRALRGATGGGDAGLKSHQVPLPVIASYVRDAPNNLAGSLSFIRRHNREALDRGKALARSPCRKALAHNLDRNAFAHSRDPHHARALRLVQKPRGTDR